jgi:hypothetical protein
MIGVFAIRVRVMRRLCAALCLLACVPLSGCLWQRKPPYSNAPVLLHYKPTLSDSATILAEKQARRGPVKPPMPIIAREGSRDEPDAAPLPKIDQIKPAIYHDHNPLPPAGSPLGAAEPR